MRSCSAVIRSPLRRSATMLLVVLLSACGGSGDGVKGPGASGGGTEAPPAPETTGRVVFASDSRTNLDLYVLDLNNGQVTALTRNPSQDLSPAPSLDGTKIPYASSSVEGPLQVTRMKADGAGA